MSDDTTIAELFARDPLTLSDADIDRIIASMREARLQFKTTGKGTAQKRPVDLKDLGLL
jgi:hypothetical protein